MTDWQSKIQAEFDRAEQAQAKGNEGQARVCARRAAGIAVREYFVRKGITPPSTSAVDLLNLLKEDPLFSPELKRIAEHLTLRVNEEFNLPVDVDLVAEARRLCNTLLQSAA